MKHKNVVRMLGLLPVFIFFIAGNAIGQCAGIKVTHTSGTQQVGCTDVTVTSDGSVDIASFYPCYYNPYWIGRWGSGSYTFTFSSPVQGVMIDVQTLDNHSGHTEDMIIDVNGIFYPITVPGTPDGCWDPAIIWPPGTIRADIGKVGSWRDIYIPGPMNEIKVTDSWTAGNPQGININFYICCTTCTTNAGTINSPPIKVCWSDPVLAPPAEQANLDADDMLQYILFASSGNPISTTLVTGNLPSFTFDPNIMIAGTTYYLAAIAGNMLNGNVDITDPCLNVSNPIEVTWMPAPIVTVFSDQPCLNPGECYDIVINFLGVPPFQLTGQVVMGNTVVSTFGGTYTTLSTLHTVCIPISAPSGPITIEATSISDAFCTCD